MSDGLDVEGCMALVGRETVSKKGYAVDWPREWVFLKDGPEWWEVGREWRDLREWRSLGVSLCWEGVLETRWDLRLVAWEL